jgi:hypothetical protein
VNNSKWNTGPKQLPPVTPAMHSYLRGTMGAAAVSGSFYHYNPSSPSPVKFPPHFDGIWSITDWVQNDNVAKPAGGGFRGVKMFKVKPEGDGLLDSLLWFRNFGFQGPLDMQFGPDGALYVLNYGNAYFGTTQETKLARIEYTGSCRPTVSLGGGAAPHRKGISGTGRFFTLRGRLLARYASLHGPREYAVRDLVPTGASGGLFMVTAAGSAGRETRLVLSP